MTEIQVFDRETVLLRERDEARADLARYRAWWNALTDAIVPGDFMDKRSLPAVQAQALSRVAANDARLEAAHVRLIELGEVRGVLGLAVKP